MTLDKAIIIIGPSAVGKTTIANNLTHQDLPVSRVVTTTTRNIRPNEKDGVDYHFISRSAFEDHIAKDEMLEWAMYNDNYYGSRWSDVTTITDLGQIPIWVTESKGAEYLKSFATDAITIFIMPADFATLRRRLERRNLPKDEIVNRIKIAKSELLHAPQADYRVINVDGKIELVVNEVADIIRKHFGL